MTSDHNFKTFFWRSVYSFKKGAVTDIGDAFKGNPKIDRRATIQFEPRRAAFILTCPQETADRTFESFTDIVHDYINRHYWNQAGADDGVGVAGNKIRRNRLTCLTQPPLEWTEDPTKMVDYDADDFDDVLEEIRSKVGEDERKKTYRWISSHKDTFGDCFYPDGADLVEKIAEKSGCVMIVEWLTSDVMIGAPNGEKLQYGIDLLEKLEEFHNTPYSRLDAHVINNVNISRFEIRLVPIMNQASTILRSTLFPPTSEWATDAGREQLYSARLLKYNQEHDTYLSVGFKCAEPFNSGNRGNAIWKDYIYPAKKSENIELVAEEKKVPIATTMGRYIPPQDPSRTSEPSTGTGTPNYSGSDYALTDGGVALGSRPGRGPPAEGAFAEPEPPNFAAKRNPRVRQNAGTGPPPSQSGTPTATPSGGSFHTAQQSFAGINEGRPTSRGQGYMPASPASPAVERRRGPMQLDQLTKVYHDDTDADTDDGYMNSGGALAAQRPVIMAPAPTIASTVRRPRTKKRGNQQEEGSSSRSDATAKPAEYNTRDIRYTQGQRAPHRRKEAFDDIKVIDEHFKSVMRRVFGVGLEEARRFVGELRFECRFGRILFPNVAKKYLKKAYVFHWKTWDEELKESGIKPLWTNMMTCQPSDVDYVTGLKIPGGLPFFQANPRMQNVIYEIYGKSFQEKEFVLRIDAQTFEWEVRSREENLGKVLWNCPTASWDAQFALVGMRPMPNLRNHAGLLVANMRIKQGKDVPDIFLNMAGVGFKIQHAICRRESRHIVERVESHHDHEFTLVVTENILMTAQENPKQPMMIRLFTGNQTDARKENRTFYSFHLVFDALEEALWQNSRLGVAEETSEEAIEILLQPGVDKSGKPRPPAIETFAAVAGEVVSKLNDVGYLNEQYVVD